MKKILLLVALATTPLLTLAADININLGGARIEAPGVTITFGTRNDRGHYWDGEAWRDADYWKRHNGPRGEKYYTGRSNRGVPHQDGGHCPPGQAKKGRC
ncbi:MAG: DUF2502 domain-containing protein [Azonexus sp.]|nr:DUF2502 domain-containing protein [Azonexus sp.]